MRCFAGPRGYKFSRLCFSHLLFQGLLLVFISRPIFSFPLASIWHDKTRQGKPSCFHGICICLIRLIFCPCKVTLMLLILRLVPDTFICIYVFLDINVIQRGHRQLNYSRSICNLYCIVYVGIR